MENANADLSDISDDEEVKAQIHHKKITRTQSEGIPFEVKTQKEGNLRVGSLGGFRKISEEEHEAWTRQNLKRRTGLLNTPVSKRNSKSRLAAHLEESGEISSVYSEEDDYYVSICTFSEKSSGDPRGMN